MDEEVVTVVERADRRGRPVDATSLHRDAVAIWRLLQDLDPDDHRTRTRLLAARDRVRATSAMLWRERGWAAITHDEGLDHRGR